MHSDHTTNEIPYGYCQCGCGQKTVVPKRNRYDIGHTKGVPLAFAKGHNQIVPVEMRFWQKVTLGPFTECWLWQGSIDNGGYGMLSVNASGIHANRVSWMLHFGDIPDGFFVCHHCDVRSCVNPYHLFLGTQLDNIHDMDAKGRRVTVSNPLRGEASTSAKLTAADVVTIRQLVAKGLSQRKVAKQYGLAQQHVSEIVRRICWAHIP